MIKKYRKKPVVVSAIQFDGYNWRECGDFMSGRAMAYPDWIKEYDRLDIETLEGTMRCEIGDYIIKGVNGEFYPCKPDIFEKTYDEVNPTDSPVSLSESIDEIDRLTERLNRLTDKIRRLKLAREDDGK